MDDFDNSFIDLTNNSLTYVNHCALADVVIDLVTDDSISDLNATFEYSPLSRSDVLTRISTTDRTLTNPPVNKKKKTTSKHSNAKNKDDIHKNSSKEDNSKFGCCPICWDELGKNSLVSTKCGHVYCLKCLERSLCVEKRCPTCRKVLKGANAYHPLYLPI